MRATEEAPRAIPLPERIRLLSDLPETLTYKGEFGYELVLFLPFMAWLSSVGLLRRRRISTYRGMRCFYDHLNCAGIEERKPHRKSQLALVPEWLPHRDEHTLTRNPFHRYPDLRAKFLRLPLLPDIAADGPPLLVIHNKYGVEWRGDPVNFLDCPTLDRLFAMLKREFRVVYIRHGQQQVPAGYSTDNSALLDLGEAEVLRAHPEVLNFDDLHAAHRAAGGEMDVNTFKNVLYSRCHRFISVQGGGSFQMAYYSGAMIAILHIRGPETRLAYSSEGFFGLLSNPAPLVAVCTSREALLEAAPVFRGSHVAAGRVLPSLEAAPLLERFSPVAARDYEWVEPVAAAAG